MISRDYLIRIERIEHLQAARNRVIHFSVMMSLLLFAVLADFIEKLLLKLFGTSGGSLCPFLNISGIPCPFCGLTRSLSSFLRGEILESFSYHPFGPILWGGTALFVTFSLALVFMRKTILFRPNHRERTALIGMVFLLIIWSSNIFFGHH